MLNIISLGAGVQSSTMALMAAHGEITPMPDCAIFADTGAEPQGVYTWLKWIETQLPYPVHRVSAGNIRDQIVRAMTERDKGYRIDGRPPFFTGKGGMLRRQCTQDFKIVPIGQKVRELIGLVKHQRGPKTVSVAQWIGISTDEASRMKPSRLAYVAHRWPLIESGMSRTDCLAWMKAHDYPMPTKSACTFCPYHNDAHWREMKANDPVSFADAVMIDELIRDGMPGPKRPENDAWFVHRSAQPLVDIDFRTAEEAGQASMFDEECEGMCGV